MGTVPNVLIDSSVMVAGLSNGICQTLSSSDVYDRSLHQWRPDWTRGNSVASDAFLTDDLVAQSSHEPKDGAFSRGVVQQLWMSYRRVDRGVEGDSGVRALCQGVH